MNPTRLKRKVIADLYAISGALARCEGMPSVYRDDWPDRLSWKMVLAEAERANNASRDLGYKLTNIVKSILEEEK
jgi:hypothetical protein